MFRKYGETDRKKKTQHERWGDAAACPFSRKSARKGTLPHRKSLSLHKHEREYKNFADTQIFSPHFCMASETPEQHRATIRLHGDGHGQRHRGFRQLLMASSLLRKINHLSRNRGKKKRKSHLTTKNIMRWGQSVKVTSPANTRAFHETRKRETGKPPTWRGLLGEEGNQPTGTYPLLITSRCPSPESRKRRKGSTTLARSAV